MVGELIVNFPVSILTEFSRIHHVAGPMPEAGNTGKKLILVQSQADERGTALLPVQGASSPCPLMDAHKHSQVDH